MMMMQVKTIPMDVYVVSAPGAVAVTATVNGVEMTLARTPEGGGQAAFQAVGECVEVSDASAVVLPFVDAPVPLGMDGGVDAVQVARMVEEAVVETTETPFVEAAHEWIKPIHWAQIDGSTVGSGVVSRVEIPCLTRAEEPELSTGELFLELYEADEAGNFVLLGVSRNAVRQQAGQVSRWVFDDVAVHGRPIRLSPTRHAGGGWDDSLVLGAGGRPRYGQEDSFVEMAAGGRSAVMLAVTISTATRVAKFAPAEHAADEVRHITAAERESWNAKANASALAGKVNTATFTAHANDAVKHVTAAERESWNHKANTTDMGNLANDLNGHIDDSVKHVTAEERGRWNAKATASELARKADVTALEAHAGSRELHLWTSNDACGISFPSSGGTSSTAGVFAGLTSSWLSARSDAVTFTTNDDGFRFQLLTTELRLGEPELQALAALIVHKDELLALLTPNTPTT